MDVDLALTGYSINHIISENHVSLIVSAQRLADNLPVVIKILNVPIPTPLEISVFKYEFQMTETLQHLNCILKPYGLGNYKNSWMMVLEDIKGQSILQYIEENSFTIKEFLRLAIKITKALAEIHQAGFVHKDIKPSNILWNREKDTLKLIGLGTATKFQHENIKTTNVKEVSGTLAYMSPEHTGRINRSVDQRSDFYSLGVTFYSMLAKQLPFMSDDSLHLIYQHITQTPILLHDLNAQIPEAISNIIAKLLAKMPEDRYQTAQGIIADLEQCLLSLNKEGSINDFVVGQHDQDSKFIIPEKLYGRSQNIDTLKEMFAQIKSGNIGIVTLAGHSGIGKTSLVHELYQPVMTSSGYFIEGKFDQFQNNTPCMALSRMLREFLKLIQSESAEKLAAWKDRIQKAVGINGQILLSVVPEFEQLIGPQPQLAPLDPASAENRFLYTFTELIQHLAQKEHPLVIFWDDVQWADSISLKLLESWFLQIHSGNLLLMFSYRDADAKLIYPFKLIINKAQELIPVNHLILEDLSLESVNQLITDTLHTSGGEVAELAEICFKKTAGNPFFLKQLLYDIYNKGLITFESTQKQWTWNLDTIIKEEIANNVLELMISRIGKLDQTTRRLLSIAACIGRKFDLNLLAKISNMDEKTVAQSLDRGLEEGFIIPLNYSYRYAAQVNDSEARYQFAHDKISEAAYSLVDEEQRITLHLKIGRLLLQNTSAKNLDKNIISIVDHLDKGIQLITEPQEIKQLIELNYQAGLKAMSSQAFTIALYYFKTAIQLSAEGDWDKHYELMLALYNQAALISSILSDESQMEEYSQIIFAHAKNPMDTVEIYRTEMFNDLSKGRPHDAIKKLSTILKKLNFNLPINPKVWYIIPTVIKTIRASKKIAINDIVNLPVMQDKRMLAIMRLLPAGFSSLPVNPVFFGMLLCNIFYLTIKYGRSEISPLGCIGFAYLLAAKAKKYALANQYAQAGFLLSKKYDYRTSRPRTIIGYISNSGHCAISYRDFLPLLLEANKIALEMGNFEFAVLSLVIHSVVSLFAGISLPVIFESMKNTSDLAKQLHQEYEIKYLFPVMQMVHNLQNESYDKIDSLNGTYFKEAEQIPEFVAHNDMIGMINSYLSKIIPAYLFEQDSAAFEYINILRPYFKNFTNHFFTPIFVFYDSVVTMRVYKNLSWKKKLFASLRIKSNLRKLKRWSKAAPMNYLSKYLLTKAEFARLHNRYKQAVANYENAISAAHEHELVLDEAIAKEQLAKFYLENNNDIVAKIYLLQAYYTYSTWRAKAKLAQLDDAYPWLSKLHQQSNLNINLLSTTLTSTTSDFNMNQLDFSSLMKSSVAISSEIHLPNLIKHLLEILTENVAAERCVLLLNRSDQLFIEGDFSPVTGIKNLMHSIPIDNDSELPRSILQYVSHSHENVLLDDASTSKQFSHDHYFDNKQVKSVLCTPILYKGALLGILYFESHTATNVFTPQRLEFINILSSQIAVSIENARLYQSFERFVPKQFLQLLGKKNLTEVDLGDSVQKSLTVLFMDIQNFTTLAEMKNVKDLFTLLNKLLSHVSPIMEKYNGFIDKFIGDAILALFPGKADDALNAAIEMQQAIQVFNKENGLNWRIGIGINTGVCMLGTLGNEARMDGSVISDTVNTASRIEGLTKVYGSEILLLDETVSSLQDKAHFSLRYVDKVLLKGKTHRSIVWECLDTWSPSNQSNFFANFDTYSQAIKSYQNGDFNNALNLFNAYSKNFPEDNVCKIYISRCKHYIEKGAPEDWEGSTTFKHK